MSYLNPEMPINPGSWLVMMVMAEPVMKPLMAGAGMNSTSQPILKSPIARTIIPQVNASVVAMSGPDHLPGNLESTEAMISATVRDITATGPMDTSLDVAKNWMGMALARVSFLEWSAYTVYQNADERRI